MSTYVFSYRSSKNYRGSPDALPAWESWLQALDSHVVSRGNPVFERSALGNTGDDTVLGGYSIIEADDLETAVALAKGCPAIANGGGVEVGELTILNS
jgi:YCII-related domain